MKYKILTIRLPEEMWRKLKLAILNGQIKSIQKAVIDGLKMLIDRL